MPRQSRIAVFCGKGGVGKTTLALALGLRRAQSGAKVVVVSSHPLAELAVAVSLQGMASRIPEAASNLFVVHLDAKELLADLVRRNFSPRLFADRVIDSSIYRNLVEAAPGLKEFYFLARLQQLAERKKKAPDAAGNEAPDYDLLIWDAPATGHFLSTLRSARAFETYLTGPLAAAGADVARFFSTAEHMTVLPVATLEEMAVAEMREMCAELASGHGLAPSAVLVNLASPMATAADAEMAALAAGASCDALRFAAARGVVERERLAEVRTATAAPVVVVPRVAHGASDLDLLVALGGALYGVPA